MFYSTEINSNVSKHNDVQDPNTVTALLTTLNGWDSAIKNVPPEFKNQYGVLLTVWTWPESIGDLTGHRVQVLIGKTIIAHRLYEQGWSEWAILVKTQ